ncbi:MAG: heavy-metal-associated domain-containing protein [Limnothrix sp. RL_2_0]|nr:heavy-metal-associated domain-containing protein [Limnothrix sp. RL_2_0]
MTLTIKVPSIACEVCGNTITKAIQSQQSDAQVAVDVTTKTVKVDTAASMEQIKAIITEAGHTPE